MLWLENIRNQTFPLLTMKDWQQKAEESLKGKSLESLMTTTYENIVLKPLYSSDDETSVPNFPSGPDYRRGVFPLSYVTEPWKIAQRISYQNVHELHEKLHDSFKKGQTAVSFEVSQELVDKFPEIVGELSEKYPFAVNAKGLQSPLLKKLAPSSRITGYIGTDPISIFAEEGVISQDFLSKWSDIIMEADENLPNLKTVLVNTSSYHHGGANAVQELAIAAATGTFYLQHLSESGWSLEKILSKMIFHFSIGSNFFMELSKLRAARILWNKITEVFGAKVESRGIQIAADTSAFTKTAYDPHVNILRAGNEAFAAVLGGIQYLHVESFNAITGSTALAERISRNTQNILKEEAHLQKVIDPAGGSWYVESLTTELAEKAWQYFQQIEANGGILEVLTSNWLQKEINSMLQSRQRDIFTRKQSIIGTNVYANLDEEGPSIKEPSADNDNHIELRGIEIESILKSRLSSPFETLRQKSTEIESEFGTKPHIGMLCLGELKQYKPRLDFMRGFLAAGGVHTVESGSVITYQDVRSFVAGLNTKFFCLCGSNDEYESFGHDILIALKKEFPDLTVFLAGLPDKELQAKWINEGIKQCIHIKSNCYQVLSTILNEMEVELNGSKA